MSNMIDFFCGCGGMGLGFKQAGWTILQAFDFDKYAVQSYRHNLGNHVEQRDIKDMKASDLQPANLWAFGFPCQDLSVAGKGVGLFEGKRSGLFFEVMRLLDESTYKPKVLLAENVSGLKPYLPVLKEEYNKRGYVMSYRFFNSKYWGVPQSRPRYFVMGIRKDIFTKGVQYYPVEQQDFVPKLAGILETNVDERYYISNEKAKTILEKFILPENADAVSVPLRFLNRNQNVLPDYAMCCDASGTNGVAIRETAVYVEPSVLNLGNVNPSGRGMNGYVYDSEGISPCCTTNKGEGHKVLIRVVGRLDIKAQDIIRRVYDPEGLAPTLTSCGGSHRQPKILEQSQFRVRKLTPREFARLQGFPDDYEIIVSNRSV